MLLPFLLPLGVLLFEPDAKGRTRMVPFAVLGVALSLNAMWSLVHYRRHQPQNRRRAVGDRHLRVAVRLEAHATETLLPAGAGRIRAQPDDGVPTVGNHR